MEMAVPPSPYRCTTAPEMIEYPSLLDKHSLSATGPCDKTADPRLARVESNLHNTAWVPLKPAESFLQVDLKENCRIAYISTKGRFPPLQSHPQNSREPRICKFTGAQIM